MAVRVTCTGCGKVLDLPARASGALVRCPGCKTLLRVPERGARPGGSAVYRRVRDPRVFAWVVLPVACAAAAVGALLLVKHIGLLVPSSADSKERTAGAPLAVVPGGAKLSAPAPADVPKWRQRRAPFQQGGGPGASGPSASGKGQPGGRASREQQAVLSRIMAGLLRDAAIGSYPGIRKIASGTGMSARVEGRDYRGNALGPFFVHVRAPSGTNADAAYICASNEWDLGEGTVLAVGTRILYDHGTFFLAAPESNAAEEAAIMDVLAQVEAATMLEDWEEAGRLLERGLERFADSTELQQRQRRLGTDRHRGTITVVNADARHALVVELQKMGQIVSNHTVGPGETARFQVLNGPYVGIWGGEVGRNSEDVTVAGWEIWEFRLDEGDRSTDRPVWRRRATRRGRPGPSSPRSASGNGQRPAAPQTSP